MGLLVFRPAQNRPGGQRLPLSREIEVSDCSSGFYESYADDAAVDGKTGNVSAATITNTSTRFTMDKVGDDTLGSKGETLSGATFELWRTASYMPVGNAMTRAWLAALSGLRAPSPESSDLGHQMQGTNQGYIVGLPAGTYTVKETFVPAGHVKAADFEMTIAYYDGAVACASDARSDVAVTVEGNTATVTVTDAVVRGEVELHKYYAAQRRSGARCQDDFRPVQKAHTDEHAENGGGVCVAERGSVAGRRRHVGAAH